MSEARVGARLHALAWMLAQRALPVSPHGALLVLRTSWRLGLAPAAFAAEHLREVLPELTEKDAGQAALRARWLELKLRWLDQLRRRAGEAAIQRHTRFRDEAGLTERVAAGVPTILLAWHYGGARFLASALSGRGLRLMVLRHAGAKPVPTGTSEALTGPGGGRALAMGKAVAHLRSGGSVLLTADGSGRSLRVPCLGRPLALSRGPFALARLCGVPIVPIVALASHPGPRLDILAHPPLATELAPGHPGYERDLARQAAQRIEVSVRESPGELRPTLLERLRRTAFSKPTV